MQKETKKYSLEELDIIFALAYEERKNPVKISLSGNIPEAGSREAHEILGRVDRDASMRRPSHGDQGEKGRRPSMSGVKRVLSRHE